MNVCAHIVYNMYVIKTISVLYYKHIIRRTDVCKYVYMSVCIYSDDDDKLIAIIEIFA